MFFKVKETYNSGPAEAYEAEGIIEGGGYVVAFFRVPVNIKAVFNVAVGALPVLNKGGLARCVFLHFVKILTKANHPARQKKDRHCKLYHWFIIYQLV